MSFYRRFKILKTMLYGLFIANAFVLSWSGVVLFKYYNGEQASIGVEQYIVLIFATAVFGIILPTLVFRQLAVSLQNLRMDAEKKFISWMNWWTKNYLAEHAKSTEPFYQKPHFWMNIFLMFVESMAPQSRNPFVGYLGELAPVLRAEFNKGLSKDDDIKVS